MIERYRFRTCDVVRLTSCVDIFNRRRQQVGLNDVGDIAEISSGFSVTEDPATLASQQARDPARDYRRICSGRILTSPEHIEVAQADRLESVAHLERNGIRFVRRLARRVRRQRATQPLLYLRIVWSISVHGAR